MVSICDHSNLDINTACISPFITMLPASCISGMQTRNRLGVLLWFRVSFEFFIFYLSEASFECCTIKAV